MPFELRSPCPPRASRPARPARPPLRIAHPSREAARSVDVALALGGTRLAREAAVSQAFSVPFTDPRGARDLRARSRVCKTHRSRGADRLGPPRARHRHERVHGGLGADGRSRIELARAAARTLSRQLAPGADALVIEAGREPRVVSPLERDPKRIDAAIERVKLGEVEGDLGSALSLATNHLRSRPGSSRIVVVTDGALARPDAFATASLPVDIVRVGTPVDNVGIVRADVARTSESAGRDRVQVFALAKNFGKTRRSAFVTLLPQHSTTPLASRRLDLAAGEEAPVTLSFDAAPGRQGHGPRRRSVGR